MNCLQCFGCSNFRDYLDLLEIAVFYLTNIHECSSTTIYLMFLTSEQLVTILTITLKVNYSFTGYISSSSSFFLATVSTTKNRDQHALAAEGIER